MIDTHAHLTDVEEERDVEALLERAKRAGLEAIINICTQPEELELGSSLKGRHSWIYNAAALTPHDSLKGEAEAWLEAFEKSAMNGELIAVGECGLDYHFPGYVKERQHELFRRQIALAKRAELPLLIHCREAFQDLFDLLSQNSLSSVLIHCFSGGAEEAEEALKRGYKLGISGIVTFKKSVALQEIVRKAPLEQLFLETDAPYLAPEGKRGLPNESSYLPLIAQKVADLKGLSLREVVESTSASARRFFKINT